MSMLALAAVAATALNVPFIPQQKDTCGAAALAMVLAYWGEPVPHDEIAGALVNKELRGIPGSELERFARERGLTATAYKGDLGNLGDFLAKGRPLIVAWDMGRGRFHDVVVVGLSGQDVIVHDPARGALRREPVRRFERRWSGAGHWTLVVTPGREAVVAPVTSATPAAPPESYEGLVALGVEQARLGRPDQARLAFERAIYLQPGRPEALVERGGLRFLAKEYDAAITDFERAIDLRPDPYTREMLATSLYLTGRIHAAVREWNRIGQPIVQNIRVEGTKRLKKGWVRREVTPSEGGLLRPRHLEGTRLRLDETGVFRGVSLRPVPLGDGKADFEVTVAERHGLWDLWPEFVARSVVYAASKKVRLRYYNPFGAGVTLGGEYKWESTQPRLEGRLFWPRPVGLPFNFYLEGGTARPTYELDGPMTLRTRGLAAGIRRVFGARTVAQVGLRARHRTFSRFRFDSPDGDLHGFDAGIERRWLDRRRHRLHSALYFFQSAEELGSDFIYPRGLAVLRYYGIVAGVDESEMPGVVFATQLQWGVGGTGMPLDDMFAPGAASEMDFPLRGHRQKRSGVLGYAPIGRNVLVGNVEWRQRVLNMKRLQGGVVLFYDGARVGDTAQGPREEVLHDAGIGLRLQIRGAPVLRLDYGWSLTGDGKTALTAGVGHVF
jgi:tetratricopeptide (TPR) repeat protein